MNGEFDSDALRARIVDLEAQLKQAQSKYPQTQIEIHENIPVVNGDINRTYKHDASQLRLKPTSASGPSIHNLLIISDSALPLGSFAYSNGLESFLAHHKPLPPQGAALVSLFNRFLRLSIQSVAFTNIPYVLAGYREPELLVDLDNDLDASTPCKVARAASIAQGRALLSVWERSLAISTRGQYSEHSGAAEAISSFSQILKKSTLSTDLIQANGHLAPVWGVVSLALDQSIVDTAYVFLFNHAKAIVSAAVRANVLGPYVAQSVLAGMELQQLIRKSLDEVWEVRPEDAGQVTPAVDLWLGRHEMLYSRIFMS